MKHKISESMKLWLPNKIVTPRDDKHDDIEINESGTLDVSIINPEYLPNH